MTSARGWWKKCCGWLVVLCCSRFPRPFVLDAQEALIVHAVKGGTKRRGLLRRSVPSELLRNVVFLQPVSLIFTDPDAADAMRLWPARKRQHKRTYRSKQAQIPTLVARAAGGYFLTARNYKRRLLTAPFSLLLNVSHSVVGIRAVIFAMEAPA